MESHSYKLWKEGAPKQNLEAPQIYVFGTTMMLHPVYYEVFIRRTYFKLTVRNGNNDPYHPIIYGIVTENLPNNKNLNMNGSLSLEITPDLATNKPWRIPARDVQCMTLFMFCFYLLRSVTQ